MRTIRFFNRASVVGADHTVRRFVREQAKCGGIDGGKRPAAS